MRCWNIFPQMLFLIFWVISLGYHPKSKQLIPGVGMVVGCLLPCVSAAYEKQSRDSAGLSVRALEPSPCAQGAMAAATRDGPWRDTGVCLSRPSLVPNLLTELERDSSPLWASVFASEK